jgi:hypothetical protein
MMSAAEISQNYVFGLLQSEEQFPVDFDVAWAWLGYTRKSNAKDKLVKSFVEGQDFCRKWSKSPDGGRSKQLIMLTINCFKQLAMMAGTEKGASVRRYFLDCEEKLKQIGGSGKVDVRITIDQAREMNNPALKQATVKEKVKLLETVERFLDKYPDCSNVVRQIFKD